MFSLEVNCKLLNVLAMFTFSFVSNYYNYVVFTEIQQMDMQFSLCYYVNLVYFPIQGIKQILIFKLYAIFYVKN